MISSDDRKFVEKKNCQATLCKKILFPQMWKSCWQPKLSGWIQATMQQKTISTNVKTLSYFCLQDPTRRPPVSPLVPLMRPEEERCSSLIVHSIKRWNGKIPSRLLYLDKKSFFFWQKKIVPLFIELLTKWYHEFPILISKFIIFLTNQKRN